MATADLPGRPPYDAGIAPFTFLHAAGLRLDEPIRDVDVVPGPAFAVLRDASLGSLDELVRLAADLRPDLVLLGGGVLGPDAGPRAAAALARAAAALSASGTDVVVALESDDVSAPSLRAHLGPRPGLTVLDAGHAATVEVRRDEAVVATVHRPGPARTRRAHPARSVARTDGPGLHLGVLGDTLAVGPDGRRVVPVADLAWSGLDYWALAGPAHAVHGREPWIVESGSVQPRDPASREPGGAVVVTSDEGRIVAVEHRPTDRVRFAAVEVPVSLDAAVEDVVDHLDALARRELAGAGGRSLVLDVVLLPAGSGPIPPVRPALVDEVLDRARQQVSGPAPVVWWRSLRVVADGARAIDDLRGRDDLLGDLVAAADRAAAGGDPAEGTESVVGPVVGPAGDWWTAAGIGEPRPDAPDRWSRGLGLALDLLDGER